MAERTTKKPVTTAMLILGAFLVVLFPFDLLNLALTSVGATMPHWLRSLSLQSEGGGGALGWWESLALFWTAIFLFMFMIVEFPKIYAATGENGPSGVAIAQSSAILAMSSLAIGVLAIALFLFHLAPDAFIYRMGSKVLLLFWIVATDVLIVYFLRVPEAARKDFRSILFTIDLPAFSALLVVAVFVYVKHGNGMSPSLEGFASGVSAMTLLFVNVAFGFQVISESTESA